MKREEKFCIFDFFDSLSQLFEISNYKNLEPIVGGELFDNILTIFNMDSEEYLLYEKSEVTIDFFQN